MGFIKIEGVGAKALLQGQLTTDLNTLIESGEGVLSAHCNPKGRIISLFHLFLYQTDYYLMMPSDLVPIALAALKKYAIFFKCQLSETPLDKKDIPTEAEWRIQKIQQGIPSIYAGTSGLFLPHDLNLDRLGGISFNKGCYTGQEIIARIHYRGTPKNRLHQITLTRDTLPLPGEEIQEGGIIVDAYEIAHRHYQALIIF